MKDARKGQAKDLDLPQIAIDLAEVLLFVPNWRLG